MAETQPDSNTLSSAPGSKGQLPLHFLTVLSAITLHSTLSYAHLQKDQKPLQFKGWTNGHLGTQIYQLPVRKEITENNLFIIGWIPDEFLRSPHTMQ